MHRLPNLLMLGTELWRGGQPQYEGFIELKDKGIKTIVNLREEPSIITEERALVRELGMEFVSIPLRPFDIPDDRSVDQFLELMQDAKNHSAFVHCLHGMDRTGIICAIYRMSAHDWSFENAYQEMITMGFHETFDNLRQAVVKYANGYKKLPSGFQ